MWGQLGHLDCEEAEERERVCACVFVGVCACMCVRKQEGGSRDEKRGGRDGEPELRL